jgi:hypothetical protein
VAVVGTPRRGHESVMSAWETMFDRSTNCWTFDFPAGHSTPQKIETSDPTKTVIDHISIFLGVDTIEVTVLLFNIAMEHHHF